MSIDPTVININGTKQYKKVSLPKEYIAMPKIQLPKEKVAMPKVSLPKEKIAIPNVLLPKQNKAIPNVLSAEIKAKVNHVFVLISGDENIAGIIMTTSKNVT